MTFSPAIQVLSQQPAERRPPDLSFEGILERFPGLAEAEAVCLTGSTAAGWGNPYSDIDVYAFSDQELDLPIDESMELWPGSDKSGVSWLSWIGRYGDTRVDMTVWPTNALEIALKPMLGPTEPEFYAAGETLEDFVYRVAIAKPLKGHEYVDGLKALIARTGYGRAVARYSKGKTELALIDTAGQLEAGDVMTARLSAMLAARFVTDACLLLAGDLCRGEKWLLRRLERTPDCGITVDEYRSTVLDGRPDESERDAAVRIARWAQSQLVRAEDGLLAGR